MSKRAISPRKASVRPHRANLLAEYSVQAGMPRRPHIEATLTMAGCRPWRSTGMARRISSAGAKKLTSMTCRRISSVQSAKWPEAPDPGIVDQHVEAAEALHDCGEHMLPIVVARHVGGQHQHFGSEGGERAG